MNRTIFGDYKIYLEEKKKRGERTFSLVTFGKLYKKGFTLEEAINCSKKETMKDKYELYLKNIPEGQYPYCFSEFFKRYKKGGAGEYGETKMNKIELYQDYLKLSNKKLGLDSFYKKLRVLGSLDEVLKKENTKKVGLIGEYYEYLSMPGDNKYSESWFKELRRRGNSIEEIADKKKKDDFIMPAEVREYLRIRQAALLKIRNEKKMKEIINNKRLGIQEK